MCMTHYRLRPPPSFPSTMCGAPSRSAGTEEGQFRVDPLLLLSVLRRAPGAVKCVGEGCVVLARVCVCVCE